MHDVAHAPGLLLLPLSNGVRYFVVSPALAHLRSCARRRYDDAAPPVGGPPPSMEVDADSERQKAEKMKALKASIEDEDLANATTGPTLQETQLATLNDSEMSEEAKMAALMGFGGFGTTKNTKVEDNHTGVAKGASQRKKERKYRQYMNRKGGFNRALDQMK